MRGFRWKGQFCCQLPCVQLYKMKSIAGLLILMCVIADDNSVSSATTFRVSMWHLADMIPVLYRFCFDAWIALIFVFSETSGATWRNIYTSSVNNTGNGRIVYCAQAHIPFIFAQQCDIDSKRHFRRFLVCRQSLWILRGRRKWLPSFPCVLASYLSRWQRPAVSMEFYMSWRHHIQSGNVSVSVSQVKTQCRCVTKN